MTQGTEEPGGETPHSTDYHVPRVSVIVPVRDGLESLRLCAAALVDQDCPSEMLEILIVDNGSAQSPASVLPPDDRVRLLDEPLPGSYNARNAGLKVARGEILAFTDADCVPSTTWIRSAMEHLLDHPDVAMIGGRVDLTYGHGTPRSGPEWFEYVHGFPQQQYVADGFAVTANMVTRRSVFDKVGPFDGHLLSGGDAEWGRRARKAGLLQVYLDSAVVAHPARDTWPELSAKTRRTTRGVVVKIRAKPRPVPHLVRLLIGLAGGTCKVLIIGWRKPELDTPSARAKYTLARIRVNAISGSVVAHGIFQSLTSSRRKDPRRG